MSGTIEIISFAPGFAVEFIQHHLIVVLLSTLVVIFRRFILAKLTKFWQFVSKTPTQIERWLKRRNLNNRVEEREITVAATRQIKADIEKNLRAMESNEVAKRGPAMKYLMLYPSTKGHIACAKLLEKLNTNGDRRLLMEDLAKAIEDDWYD